MAKRTVAVDEAVGMVLSHDVTEIRGCLAEAGGFKGAAFRKGHVIRAEDVEHFKRLGKEHLYVLTLDADEIHEDEAAAALATALSGSGVRVAGPPTEGKITLVAEWDGLLHVDVAALHAFNSLGDVMCATLHDRTPVAQGEPVAATRLIPLTAPRQRVEAAVAAAGAGVVRVQVPRSARAGLVITGSEVASGRVRDAFAPVLSKKLEALGSSVLRVAYAPDDVDAIAAEIGAALEAGADLIVTSGGLSVDPDDVTRLGILAAGAVDLVYGSPVLPGAMFASARIGEVPVLGVPACGMYHRITVLDLVLPRVLCGEVIDRDILAQLGHGGLCRSCPTCRYPVCDFGRF